MYQAIVSTIKTAPHPNADRLQIGFCHGFQVVVSLETQDNQLGVFFPTDGQLSDEFCIKNDLYPRYDSEGKKIGGGFIEPKNRRIRAQNFRKVKSDGFWVPISYFDYIPNLELKEGLTFTELNGHEICSKYINPATLKAIKNAKKGENKKVSHKETPLFPMHEDTKQLKYFINSLPIGSTIYISEKVHGTSGRTGKAPAPTTSAPTLLQRLRKAVDAFRGIEEDKYQILTGSRRVIKDARPNESGYYSDDSFRYDASNLLGSYLRRGEAIYYEIVGYAGDTPIMPSVDNKSVGKDFVKKFGKTTEWTYGCAPGQFEIYVYNWMISGDDGFHYSYPWEYIETQCERYGLKVVPKLAPKIKLVADQVDGTNRSQVQLASLLVRNPESLSLNRQELSTLVSYLTEDRFSTIGRQSHLSEGVCLRVEQKGSLIGTFKNKCQSFGILEGYIKTDQDYVDTEELEAYV